MLQNWRLLAILLSLPILSVSAKESLTQNMQEVALDETAYNAKLGSGQVGRCSRKNADKPVPEEEAIRSQPVITPQVAPHIVDGTDTFVAVDFIWWKTHIEGMEYAYGGVSDGGFAVSSGKSTGKGSAQLPHFDYQPGVKVGLGWHFDHDGWDMLATWTYLIGSEKGSSATAFPGSGTGMTSAQPVFFNDGTMAPSVNLTSASSKWKQDFNVIDLELGRDFFLSRYLTMRPHIGFKSAWIHETTANTLTPISGVVDGSNTISSISLHNSEHLWGIGIRSGLDTGWHMTKNWMFYGDIAFTNLWGRFKKKAVGTNTEAALGSVTTLNSVESYSTILPVIETGIGLSYIEWFMKNRYRFEVRLGWEEQVWIGYNRSQDYIRSGSLTTEGLTLKTMLNF